MKTKTAKRNKFNYDFEKEMEFLLIGIVSHLDDYSICWSLNHKLNIHLSKREDIIIENKRSKQTAEYPCFSFYDEEEYKDYVLLQNKSGANRILNELTEIDYFLKISGFIQGETEENILKKLKKIEGISLAYKINHKLLSKTNQTKFLSIFTTISA